MKGQTDGSIKTCKKKKKKGKKATFTNKLTMMQS